MSDVGNVQAAISIEPDNRPKGASVALCEIYLQAHFDTRRRNLECDDGTVTKAPIQFKQGHVQIIQSGIYRTRTPVALIGSQRMHGSGKLSLVILILRAEALYGKLQNITHQDRKSVV